MRHYEVFINDGSPVSDELPTLSAAKDELRRCYCDDYAEAFEGDDGEDPALDFDYYIEEFEENDVEIRSVREIHYKPYFNKKGTVSLHKLKTINYE